jgi:hypothetical protein
MILANFGHYKISPAGAKRYMYYLRMKIVSVAISCAKRPTQKKSKYDLTYFLLVILSRP